MKTFYKIEKEYCPLGVVLNAVEFYSVHETECYHFCVKGGWELRRFEQARAANPEMSAHSICKNKRIKLYHIDKRGSRIAKPTTKDAFERFRINQSRRLEYLKRDIEIQQALVDGIEHQSWDGMLSISAKDDRKLVNSTSDAINEHYVFD